MVSFLSSVVVDRGVPEDNEKYPTTAGAGIVREYTARMIVTCDPECKV